jgi:hypothetical protein
VLDQFSLHERMRGDGCELRSGDGRRPGGGHSEAHATARIVACQPLAGCARPLRDGRCSSQGVARNARCHGPSIEADRRIVAEESGRMIGGLSAHLGMCNHARSVMVPPRVVLH